MVPSGTGSGAGASTSSASSASPLGSALCAFAQTPVQLGLFRVLQGVAAALLVPGALALIQSSFREQDRPAAIGTWAGVSGVATAVGPLIGGFLVDHAGWRWIFAINLPLCALVVLMGMRAPESRDETVTGRFDVAGAAAGAVALGVTTYLLTSWRTLGAAVIVVGVLVALAASAAFVVLEQRPHAMAPHVAVPVAGVLGRQHDELPGVRRPRVGAVLPGAAAAGQRGVRRDRRRPRHGAHRTGDAAALLAGIGARRPPRAHGCR